MSLGDFLAARARSRADYDGVEVAVDYGDPELEWAAMDARVGLVRFGMRDYEPAAGRWTARDPILVAGGQLNLYAYVASAPVGQRDPSGLYCVGATAYAGMGGGGKMCFDRRGFSICPELGFGLGESIDVNPTGSTDENFFGFTGHVHKLGRDVTVDMTDPAGAVGAYRVEDFLWSEPPTVYHDPPLVLGAGEGFDITCHYQNDTANEVGFGEQADDEMCFFWAYYYPSEGSRVCAHTDQIGAGLDVCCPGNPLCEQIF